MNISSSAGPKLAPKSSAPERVFQVGDAKLDPEVVNEESIRNVLKAAIDSGAQGKQPFDVQAFGDKWLETGTVSEKEYKGFSSLHWHADKKFGSIRGEWWDAKNAGDKDGMKKADEKMSVYAQHLALQTPINDAVKVGVATAMVTAIAGASFGPIGTVSAYAAWNGLTEEDTKELVDTMRAWESGESRMINEGNEVKQVHREHLWKAKHEILDEAKALAEAGTPVELDLQYYEMTSDELLGKVGAAALAGNKVRVNVDTGRLSYPDKNDKGETTFEVDDMPDKMRAIIQLTSLDADVGVSVFPALKNLGNAENLMHRKLIRMGDKALLPGMNANNGSGENVDAGYLLQGPVVATLVENFSRDVAGSIGVGRDEIWGDKQKKSFDENLLLMGTRGLAGLFDVLSGPSPAGTPAAKVDSYETYVKLAEKAGLDPAKIYDIPASDLEQSFKLMLDGGEKLPLSAYGKAQLTAVVDRALANTQTETNIERLKDIKAPERVEAGKTVVAIADLPAEREAMMLKAISEAEEFIYVPGFVVTRGVASAIVARRDELRAEGKELDVKLVADSGVYPGGSTPNAMGVQFLEDHGIAARWSKLVRTGWHDRKIHAKQLITDKHEMFGSTNFSKKAMKENWEHSGLVSFDPADKTSMQNREESIAQFMDLWNHETFELSSIDLATAWSRNKPELGHAWFVESSRDGAVKKVIGLIEDYEEQSGVLIEGKLQDKAIAALNESNLKAGMADGYALLKAVESTMGTEALYAELGQLAAAKELDELKAGLR